MLFLNIPSLYCSLTNLLIFLPFSVSISDPFFSLYNSWMKDIVIVAFVLMVYFIFVIWYLISNLKGKWTGGVLTLRPSCLTDLFYILPEAPLYSLLLAKVHPVSQENERLSPQMCLLKLCINILRINCCLYLSEWAHFYPKSVIKEWLSFFCPLLQPVTHRIIILLLKLFILLL